MRGAYLRSKDLNRELKGQRGGVGNPHNDGEFELEIGTESHASPELLALCQIHDEVIELLTTSPSHLAALVLREYRRCVKDLNQQLEESRRNQ